MSRVSLNIDIESAVRWVIASSALVLLAGYFREAYVAIMGAETALQDLRQLALDTEHCLGSFYSSVLMGIASLLMVVVGQHEGTPSDSNRWYFLALVFAFMSLDESVSFHEVLITPLQPMFGFSSFLYFAWIVPGALFAIAMGAVYLPFVLRLSPPIRNRIMLAGSLYVTGALGMEAVGGHFNSIGGFDHPLYITSFIVEETLEIVGLTLFAVALLHETAGRADKTGLGRQGERRFTHAPAE